jgi:hypothetical protein
MVALAYDSHTEEEGSIPAARIGRLEKHFVQFRYQRNERQDDRMDEAGGDFVIDFALPDKYVKRYMSLPAFPPVSGLRSMSSNRS